MLNDDSKTFKLNPSIFTEWLRLEFVKIVLKSSEFYIHEASLKKFADWHQKGPNICCQNYGTNHRRNNFLATAHGGSRVPPVKANISENVLKAALAVFCLFTVSAWSVILLCRTTDTDQSRTAAPSKVGKGRHADFEIWEIVAFRNLIQIGGNQQTILLQLFSL